MENHHISHRDSALWLEPVEGNFVSNGGHVSIQ